MKPGIVLFTGIVVLDVRRNSELIRELWPVVRGIQFEEFREEHGAMSYRDKSPLYPRCRRNSASDRRVQDALHCGEVSSGGSDGVGYLYTVSAGCSMPQTRRTMAFCIQFSPGTWLY